MSWRRNPGRHSIRNLFLAKVGEGRSIGKYRKEQIVFSQEDPADAVFYIQKGKVKITVVSEQGKEAVALQFRVRTSSSVKDVWPGRCSA